MAGPATTSLEQEVVTPYLPRLLVEWPPDPPPPTAREIAGTLAFVDISGFTKMSERLARRGKEGAEEVAGLIGTCFTSLLSVAYGEGGGLVKFGGDALLLFFHGPDHEVRGARAVAMMRRRLREIGKLPSSAGQISLRMSVGVHSGTFLFLLVGTSHRELIITGPGATRTVEMEQAA
ncbi:MAG TPA: adenylate/guanylate cyclase domain-containing protein, partial [Actinomycetota bacterium]|nr:adenylate/guanylate cyclase domain-containing protein [Actinomycetota bacterium]